jgi:transposase
VRLFVGDDWAEDHHDVELMDPTGRVLAKARLPEGVVGMTRLHTMIGQCLGERGEDGEDCEVVIGIETDRGLWVRALIAAGYSVLAVNPVQAARYRERLSVSGAKSDGADAHMLADMVRTDSHQLRPVAGDSAEVEAIKVVARAHKTLIWERTRHGQRLRHALLAYFPAALEAFDDLDAPEALALLAKAPDPVSAARLSISQIRVALTRARRRDVTEKATKIAAALRAPHLQQPAVIASAYAATTRSAVALLTVLDEQVKTLHKEVETHFGRHPATEIVLSQPGLGPILGARVLAEFGDDPHRYTSAKARKNYAATSPITRASGRRKVALARYVHNDRLIDALSSQAFSALSTSPGARAYYNRLKARGVGHQAALRQLANRLVGILHGCLKTSTLYNETTAWSHQANQTAA